MHKHLSILEYIQQQEEQFTFDKKAFFNYIGEIQEIVFVLEATRFLTFNGKEKIADKKNLNEATKHPHWDLAITKLFKKLYPSSVPILNTEIKMAFLPFNLPYQLMLEGHINAEKPRSLVEEFTNVDILYRFLGENSITVSDYLLAFQFNLFRLLVQNNHERKLENFKHIGHIPSEMVAEICIFYVAANVGVKKAIGYIEALWRDGWLHNVYIFSEIWFSLNMWHRSNPTEKYYRLGREKYVEDILFSQKNADNSAEEFLFMARHIMKIARKSINDGRVMSKNYPEWLHCVHKNWLNFEAIKLAKHKRY